MFKFPPNLVHIDFYGSRGYGLQTPESDWDLKGVFIPSRESLYAMAKRDDPDSIRHQAERIDIELLDIRKFFLLAAKNNPTILDILYFSPGRWASKEGVLQLRSDPDGREIMNLFVNGPGKTWWEQNVWVYRDRFLSQAVRQTYGGYANAQLKRIERHLHWLQDPPTHLPTREEFGLPERPKRDEDEIAAANILANEYGFGSVQELLDAEKRYLKAKKTWDTYQEWLENRNPKRAELERKFSYDVKHAMHLYRLLLQGVNILESGRLDLKEEERILLKRIRAGEFSYEELMRLSEAKFNELETSESNLPEHADFDEINKMCVRCIKNWLDG